MAMHKRPTEKPVIPRRYRRVIILLQEKPRTAVELGLLLGMTPRTVRSYLSEIAKLADVYAEGAYGETKYFIRTHQYPQNNT